MMVARLEITRARPLKFLDFKWALPSFCYKEERVNLVSAAMETELAALKEKLLMMASYAEAAVNRAVKALIRRDDDLARRTREEDDLIDHLEMEIDDAA